MRNRNRTFLLALGLTLVATAAMAQRQTGGVIFEVFDTSGQPLPDVAVTLDSPALQGFQFRETDERGRARFLALPPGTYLAEFLKGDFITIRKEVDVRLGDQPTVAVVMTEGELSEDVDVSGSPPIDPTETQVRTTYTYDQLKNIQIGSAGRSYQSVLAQTAGTSGGANPSVHGSTLGENRYLLDGVDTTDPVTGTFGTNLNFDIIDQVEFLTGGFRAENGLSTGGISNVVTKSGGNEVEGIFDVRYSNESFIENSPHFPAGQDQLLRRFDFTLGGPVLQDKLWYQIGFSDIANKFRPAEIEDVSTGIDAPNPDGPATREFDGAFYFGKLRWQVNPDHRVDFQYTADPADITHANASPFVTPEAGQFQEQGSSFWTLSYWGRPAEDWILEIQYGDYSSELNSFPVKDSGVPSVFDYATNVRSRNYNDAQFSERFRRELSVTAEYLTRGQRWHDIKFGAELQDISFEFERQQPGGSSDFIFSRAFGDLVIQRLVLNPAGRTENEGLVRTFFIQDTWHASDRVTFDYGLRYDAASFDNDVKQEVADFELLQPRLGVAIDVRDDGRHVVSASAGRYMHPGILTFPSQVNERHDATVQYLIEDIFVFDCNGDGVFSTDLVPCSEAGTPSRIDPDLDATTVDEFTLGYKWAIRPQHVFGSRLILRNTDDIIEDRRVDGAPGADDDFYFITNIPELRRRYRGLELTYDWDGRRSHMQASWTISSAKGNIEYTQGLGTDFDVEPYHFVNRYGYLSYDEKHVVKVQGWVDLPRQWIIAYDFGWGSGAPFNRLSRFTSADQTTPVEYGERFVDPRGSHRLPATARLDVEVKKAFDIGPTNLQLIGSIRNLFFENEVIDVEDIFDADDPDDWGSPTAYQSPRRYEVGLRLTF